MKKISILYENLVSMKHDDYYRNVISPPITARKVGQYYIYHDEFFNEKILILQYYFPECYTRSRSNSRGRANVFAKAV